MYKYLFKSLIILFNITLCFSECKIESIIQPWYTFHENGSWIDSGSSELGLHRAKVSVYFKKKFFPKLRISSKITADFAEKRFENILENAYISLKIIPQINLKVGKFKVPFGANNLISSLKLPTIYRSFTTDHMKKDLKIAGFQKGGIIYGTLFDFLTYSAGTFHYEENHIKGFQIEDILDFPVFSLTIQPKKYLSFYYIVTAPQAGISLLNKEIEAMRIFYHDFAVQFNVKDFYEVFAELFIGIDTSLVQKTQLLLSDYDENIAYSIYTLNSFLFSPFKKLKIKLTLGLEYLNGLNYYDYQYQNRSFYYSLLESVTLYFNKNLFLQLSYDSQYDEHFKPINHRRIAAQILFRGVTTIKKDKKKKSEKSKKKK